MFSEDEVCIISQDDYYRPIGEQARDENGQINFDLPSGIDDEAFLHDVKLLAAGKGFTKKEYTFNNPGKLAGELVFKPAPLIVVEGLFIFYFKEISSMLDLKVFIDAEEELKLDRRLKRDTEERGYSREDILYQWENHVVPASERYLLPYREGADIIITNNYSLSKGIKIIADHIRLNL